MREDVYLWYTDRSRIFVPDDLEQEYAKAVYQGQIMEKSGTTFFAAMFSILIDAQL